MNLENIMREERIRQGISQQKLADAAGVTKRTVTYWESGIKKMSVENADKVFKVLHLSITIGEQQCIKTEISEEEPL